MTPTQSRALNRAIWEVCDDETLPAVIGLGVSGKRIPYIGWYWRDVDFTQPIGLGRCRVGGPTIAEQIHGLKGSAFVPGWAGFMENNKWDYPEWTTTQAETDAIVAALRVAVKQPTQRNLQAVFDVIQSTMPDSIRNWDGKTGWDDWDFNEGRLKTAARDE